jgi:predicted Na+-dependent transporter
MLVIAANASPVAGIIRFDNPEVWKIMGLCVTLSASGFLLSRYSAAVVKRNGPKGIALFFAGGLRNISAVTTIAVTFFPEAAALPALMGIMFQQTLSAIMGKLCINAKRLMGSA